MDLSINTTPVTTPPTSVSSEKYELEAKLQDLKKYIALGCLHLDHTFTSSRPVEENDWAELSYPDLPDELRELIGNEAARLLEARWIRMFVQQLEPVIKTPIARIYLLPEDWGRKFIDRNSRSLKAALRNLLPQIDVSTEAWLGHHSPSTIKRFDPWATADDASLFYLFNRLPSPAPVPETIKSRYSRRAVEDLLDSVTIDPTEDLDYRPIPGLKSRLYPYQARSASLMIQREAAPRLQLDPRFDVRKSPDGETFYFGARDGSFVKEPKFYEANRGGILAETMVSLVIQRYCGLTVTCLARYDFDYYMWNFMNFLAYNHID
jgi:hypothetical protein